MTFIGNSALRDLQDFLNENSVQIIHLDTTTKTDIVLIYKIKL